MLYVLLVNIWTIAGAFLIWLFPDIFVYSLSLFMARYFGGEPGVFPTGKALAAAGIFGVAMATSVYITL